MPETNASGWNIYYETHGERANPPLLMILGLSHRLAHWGRLPGLLSERLFVVTFDCRGMGQSERRDEPYECRLGPAPERIAGADMDEDQFGLASHAK